MPDDRFSHAYDFAFEVESADFYGDDVTPEMLRTALIRRAEEISDEEIMQACSLFDTKKVYK